jgi:nucleotide-binding universal stress UspA family protein
MYRRILISTDTSAPSQRGILASIMLASALGAEVVGLAVTAQYRVWKRDANQMKMSPEQYAAHCEQRARDILGDITLAALNAGVACRVLHAVSGSPYEAIIAAARDQQYDLVSMASHGARGLRGLLLGSETQKVLEHSTVPVLVHR